MNIIKLILAFLGIFLGAMVILWVLGFLYSIIWYLFWIGVVGGVLYGGYRLFRKAEQKFVTGGTPDEIPGSRDINMTWDEYERKYLNK